MTTTPKPRALPQPGETRAYPVLPLRDIVVFPHMIVPLFVGREKSIRALEEVMRTDTFILLATQKNASDDDPATDAIFEVGTLASVLQLLKLPDGTEKVLGLMESEISVLQVEKRIRTRVKRQMEKTQREYYLNEQMKAIQKELGDTEDGRDEISELEKRIKKTRLSKEAREKAHAELKKLRTMSPMSAEATVVRNYLDWMLSIPWRKPTKIIKDLKYAEEVLNADHHGLEKVKERILEYLAVQQRVDKMKGPILCLVGPPGVGKTSLGQSVARATGRKFVRMALGGVRDE